MKVFIFSTNFLILMLTTLPLSLCSKDDDKPVEPNFEPVTIDLTGLNVSESNTTLIVDGFSFDVYRVRSQSDGLLLAFPQDGNPSMLELNLSSIEGVTKITSVASDYGGNTKVSIWNNGNLVEEKAVLGRDVNTSFSLVNRNIDKLRITSIEGIITSIKLE